jgi:hypothetical protein
MAMKIARLSVLSLAGVLAVGTTVEAQVGVDLRSLGTEIVSRRLYHGYERGDGWSVAPDVDLGLAGFAVTSRGRWGVSLDLAGGVLLQDRALHPGSDDVAFTLLYEGKLGENQDHRLDLGYRQSLFPDSGRQSSHSEELFARFQPLLQYEKSGFNIRPFVEVSYDFTRYHGVYTAVGFDHEISLEKRLHISSSLKLTGRVALSNQLAGDLIGSRGFGFHHGGFGLSVPFEHAVGSSTLVFGPQVSWDWAAEAVRSTGGFAWGAAVRLVR